MKFAKPHSPRLDDPQAEVARRTFEKSIGELQKRPAMTLEVVAGVELPDGVEVHIAHKLGRAPAFVRESCPRGATSSGRVVEVRSSGADRSKVVVLKATGWGATITVDVQVM